MTTAETGIGVSGMPDTATNGAGKVDLDLFRNTQDGVALAAVFAITRKAVAAEDRKDGEPKALPFDPAALPMAIEMIYTIARLALPAEYLAIHEATNR